MNLNEVKKQVYLQIAIYIGIGLCLILSLIVILATPVKAATQLISQDVTNTIQPYNNICSGGYKDYCIYSWQNNNASTLTIPNNYLYGSNNVLTFALKIPYGFYSSSPTTITFEFTNNIINNSNYTCSIETTDGYVGTCTATRTSNTKMNINFTSLSGATGQYQFFVSNSGGINSSDYFGIKKIVVYQTVGSDNSDIIENNNQNTTDIINNNNANSQDTQNTINNGVFSIITELANRCSNLISPNLFTNGLYAEANGSFVDKSHNTTINNVNVDTGLISLTTSQEWWGIANTDYIPIAPQGTYHLKFNSNLNNYMVDVFYYNSNKQYLSYSQTWNINNITFTAPVNVSYVRIGFSSNNYGTFTISNLTLNADNSSFCPYGSTISKLDSIGGVLGGIGDNINTTNDKLQDEYDYLTDDSDPSVNSNGINNLIGEVQVQDPLNYLLTLPLNLLTKLNTLISSGTCSRASFGELYGTELYLPCINFENYLGSSLWGTIDTIVGIGLLVVILKKFYDTISNILSLGKEEEIRKGMELPTPMEFLAQILGGGK